MKIELNTLWIKQLKHVNEIDLLIMLDQLIDQICYAIESDQSPSFPEDIVEQLSSCLLETVYSASDSNIRDKIIFILEYLDTSLSEKVAEEFIVDAFFRVRKEGDSLFSLMKILDRKDDICHASSSMLDINESMERCRDYMKRKGLFHSLK